MIRKNLKTKFSKFGIGLVVMLAGYSILVLYPESLSQQQNEPDVVGVGSVDNLQKIYAKWSDAYRTTKPVGPVLAMLWTKGLSSETNKAKGIAQLNFEKNIISVRVDNLTDSEISDVWMVDNLPGPGRSVVPEKGDRLVKIGSLNFAKDGYAWLDAKVENLAEFQLDMIVLARNGGDPGKEGVLYGTTSLFQKIFHYPQYQAPWRTTFLAANPFINDASATGITPRGFFANMDANLLNRGRDLFFNEDFDGNGRNCGTCHRENDNLALSLKTIASLPDDDPLFIVEQEFRQDGSPNPLFNDFRMEKPVLMCKAGLIVENQNGFRDTNNELTTLVNMRAPNHVLSIRTTLAPPPAEAFDDGTLPPDPGDLKFDERTGWSGDGTPTGFREDFFESNGRDLTGSLRDFVIGAIIQHYPLTLERSASNVDEDGNPRTPDFRFATEEELDAMEAFMLSIGRQEENDDLNTISLSDELADRGRLNFMGFNLADNVDDGLPQVNCNSCHLNGGANTDPSFAFNESITPNHGPAELAANGGSIPSHNRSFGPQVERLADQAGDVLAQSVDDPSVAGNCFDQGLAEIPLLPGDGPGVPSEGCDANPFDNGFLFGFNDPFADRRIVNNRFNAPVVFESADNPPFFHGHQINTIEGAVAFYASVRSLRNGETLPAIVPLNGSQVANVARFIRVMGADFNITSAIQLLEKAKSLRKRKARSVNIRLAFAETIDAIELLDPVDLHIEDAVPLLKRAKAVLRKGSKSGNSNRIARATHLLNKAQRAMVTRGVDSFGNSFEQQPFLEDSEEFPEELEETEDFADEA